MKSTLKVEGDTTVAKLTATGSISGSSVAATNSLTVAGQNVCRADGTDCPKAGLVFTQWGRVDCPSGSSTVYSGYAGGKSHDHSGSGGNTLCLTNSPTWLDYNDTNQNGALVYGMEYELSGTGLSGNIAFKDLHDTDAPCAVCLTTAYSTQIMIPGTYKCPAGWNSLYHGYLMATHYTQGTSEFQCVSASAQGIGSKVSQNGNLWYPTEAECGSLPCLPYVQDRELTCAVCAR